MTARQILAILKFKITHRLLYCLFDYAGCTVTYVWMDCDMTGAFFLFLFVGVFYSSLIKWIVKLIQWELYQFSYLCSDLLSLFFICGCLFIFLNKMNKKMNTVSIIPVFSFMSWHTYLFDVSMSGFLLMFSKRGDQGIKLTSPCVTNLTSFPIQGVVALSWAD